MAVLPIACFAGLMIYLGQRLVRSGLDSDGAELWLGLCFVPVGIAIVVRFSLATGLDLGSTGPVVNLIAQGVLHFGIACFGAFVWRTFRPADNWGRSLFLLIVGVYTLNLALFGITGAHASQSHPFNLVLSACLSLVFGWAFVEALLYYESMRRRMGLGLADPVITNRFLLFALWTGGMMLLPLTVTAVRVVSMISTDQSFFEATPAGLAVKPAAAWTIQVIRSAVLVIGIPMLSGIWLAFFPPRRYTSWLKARAAV